MARRICPILYFVAIWIVFPLGRHRLRFFLFEVFWRGPYCWRWGGGPPDSPVRSNNSPGNHDEQPESPDNEAEDRHHDGRHADVQPDVSGNDRDCGRFHTMASHLAKLDSLTARGSADKFFKVHTDRWAPSMARPGDYLHSARAGGADPREIRKRRAAHISRSSAEAHAFCSSSNLSHRLLFLYCEKWA
jgi:hypothetical protein